MKGVISIFLYFTISYLDNIYPLSCNVNPYLSSYIVVFIACISFLFATWVKNANATAVIMVIIGLFFLIMAEPLQYSKWNIFLNPFDIPSDLSHTVWQNVINQNRLMLIIASIVALLGSMVNLQKREKFV